MNAHIPSIGEVRTALEALSLKELEALAERSKVPYTTIYKIRRGETANPGIETIRLFMGHIKAVRRPQRRAGDRPTAREGR